MQTTETPQSPTTAMPTAATAAVTTTPYAPVVVNPQLDIPTESLRKALRSEIRKFVSKELKQKAARAYGIKTINGDDPVGGRDSETSAKRPHHPDDISLELSDSHNICQENERVVMVNFPESTRKPYTAATETVKARDHRQCLEQCESNPDCSSAVFSDSMCEMSTTRARHSVPDIRPADNHTYIEKTCVDKILVRGND
ncbi:PAN domain protein [Cooperia oncophora]